MKSPNSIYEDTTIYGGIPASSADIIKIFCNIERVIKIRRSIIKLEHNNDKYFYTLYNPDIILKVNGTAVLVRATTLDLSKIYIFDAKSDVFLGVVEETLEVFGDAQSMKEHPKDKYAIMRHGKKIKQIESEFEARLKKNQEENEEPLDDIDLEVIIENKANLK